MTKNECEALKHCTVSCVGKSVRFKYKGKSDRFLLGIVEDVVSTIVSDYNHMIQRIKLSPETARKWGVGNYVYRTCYYTLSAETRKLGFGRNPALVPAADYRKLAKKANKKGWLGLPKA